MIFESQFFKLGIGSLQGSAVLIEAEMPIARVRVESDWKMVREICFERIHAVFGEMEHVTHGSSVRFPFLEYVEYVLWVPTPTRGDDRNIHCLDDRAHEINIETFL